MAAPSTLPIDRNAAKAALREQPLEMSTVPARKGSHGSTPFSTGLSIRTSTTSPSDYSPVPSSPGLFTTFEVKEIPTGAEPQRKPSRFYFTVSRSEGHDNPETSSQVSATAQLTLTAGLSHSTTALSNGVPSASASRLQLGSTNATAVHLSRLSTIVSSAHTSMTDSLDFPLPPENLFYVPPQPQQPRMHGPRPLPRQKRRQSIVLHTPHHSETSQMLPRTSQTPSIPPLDLRPPFRASRVFAPDPRNNSIQEVTRQPPSTFREGKRRPAPLPRTWSERQTTFQLPKPRKLKPLPLSALLTPRTQGMHQLSIIGAFERIPSRTLFFAGFILGPWCWLFGGWLPELTGQASRVHLMSSGIMSMPSTPHRKAQLGDSFLTIERGEKIIYTPTPRSAFSPNSSLPGHNRDASWPSSEHGTLLNPGQESLWAAAEAETRMWVRRCRIMTVIAGLLLLGGVIAAIVIAADRSILRS